MQHRRVGRLRFSSFILGFQRIHNRVLLIQRFLQLADSCCRHPVFGEEEEKRKKKKKGVGNYSQEMERTQFCYQRAESTQKLNLPAIPGYFFSLLVYSFHQIQELWTKQTSVRKWTASAWSIYISHLSLPSDSWRQDEPLYWKQTNQRFHRFISTSDWGHQLQGLCTIRCQKENRLIFLGFYHLESIKPVAKEEPKAEIWVKKSPKLLQNPESAGHVSVPILSWIWFLGNVAQRKDSIY